MAVLDEPLLADVPAEPVRSPDDQAPELKAAANEVREAWKRSDTQHRFYRDRWASYAGLYRNYTALRDAYTGADTKAERDELTADAAREWRTKLHIPITFATVETVVPRALASNPKMQAKPLTPQALGRTEPVRRLLEQQMDQIGYAMKLQPAARFAFKYGLGVTRTFWDKQVKRTVAYAPSATGAGSLQAVKKEVVHYEGPNLEAVNIWDFRWDPVAVDMKTARYVIFRSWRDDAYVLRMMREGKWFPVDPETVKRLGSDAAYSGQIGDRMRFSGAEGYGVETGKLHDIREYHDGERVITIMDDSYVVVYDHNPAFHREISAQIFRPTMVEDEFVGIGEIEPNAHLQYELDTLRSQRRDNATSVLHRSYLYLDGMVDPEEMMKGPGVMIPVGTDVGEVLWPFPTEDIPASGYAEEDRIKADMEFTSGIAETIAGGEQGAGPAAGTATGIQTVLAAANRRIQAKVENMMREMITPQTRQFLELNRQHIIAPRQVAGPDNSEPEGVGFTTVGRPELEVELEIAPVAGSTEPEYPAQKKADAAQLYNLVQGNPLVDQAKAVEYLLTESAIPDAEAWIKDPEEELAIELAMELRRMGVPDDVLEQALATVRDEDPAGHPEDVAPDGEAADPADAEIAPESETEE